jgi:ribose transport system ATP-binding protein
MLKKPIVEVSTITKVFPGVRALDKVSLKLFPGEVHGLVGENGAGKSTLIKIISGVYQPNSGEIFINGKREIIKDPSHALHLGIVPVHQELNLEQHLSVAENIFIGRQPKSKLGLIDYPKMNQLAAEWLNELGVPINPEMPLGMISIAERQMVSIARAISLDAKLLIFDEPTSSLSERETNALFQAIRKLKKKGISIIYISHRLDEVFKICDYLTVMRDGSVVAEKSISEITSESIIRLMIGRDIKDMYHKEQLKIGKQVLEVRNLSVKGILKDISFNIKSGEIVGIAGLVGAGRTELARAIFGDLTKSSGQVFIDGELVKIKTPSDGIKAGIGLVPEDRKEQGLVLGLPVAKNIVLAIISKITSLGIINQKKETEFSNQYVNQLSIRTPSINQPVQYLSGGNQQRVVIAKWLATNPKLLLVDEPTRGIDVGAKAAIHTLLNELAKKGVAILMISSELPEILAMSDRILVMHQGQLKAELIGKKATEEEVMRYAIGHAAG